MARIAMFNTPIDKEMILCEGKKWIGGEGLRKVTLLIGLSLLSLNIDVIDALTN